MAYAVSGLNPEILRWARERSGYSLADVAAEFKKDVSVIVEWESGISSPTYVQLEKLAYKLYKRPIALFFFPEPPEEHEPEKEFRTLPRDEITHLEPDTRYALRLAEAMQLSLRELSNGKNPAERMIFRDLKLSTADSISQANRVREYLDISIEEQSQWGSTREAMEHWRTAVEKNGVFVFKRSFRENAVSGFCLLDEEFPLIYLNNSTSFTRQIFTLFHELAHILSNTSGITKRDDSYIHSLKGSKKRIEVLCNQFAADFLVPRDDFEKCLREGALIPTDESTIGKIADRYKVSREVILRRLLDKGLVDRDYYEEKSRQWVADYERKSNETGGNYYATQVAYLGDKFLQLAFSKYYQGRCTPQQLADYLNIKAKNLAGLEQFFLNRTAVA